MGKVSFIADPPGGLLVYVGRELGQGILYIAGEVAPLIDLKEGRRAAEQPIPVVGDGGRTVLVVSYGERHALQGLEQPEGVWYDCTTRGRSDACLRHALVIVLCW